MVKHVASVLMIGMLAAACQQSAQPPAAADASAAPAAGAAPAAAATDPAAAAAPASTVPGAPATGGQASAAAPAGAAASSPSASAAAPTSAAPSAPAAPSRPPEPPKPPFKEITVPSGTAMQVTLETSIASDTSKAEDPVRGKLARAVNVDGVTAVPSGSEIYETVLEANGSGKVKGLASIAFSFNRLAVRNEKLDIRTSRISRQADTTKKEDAKKVGIGAGAGALIGAIAGGGKGAAIGTAIGGGAGAGVVMATKGEEVKLGAGNQVTVTLQEPLKVLVPLD
jgi:hypothetical protein